MKFRKGSPEAKAHMARLRAMVGRRPRPSDPVQGVKDHFGYKNPGTKGNPSFGGKIVHYAKLGNAAYQIERAMIPISVYGERKGLFVPTVFVGQTSQYAKACPTLAAAKEEAVRTIKKIQSGRANPPRTRKGAENALDKQIEQAYYKIASGVQVSIMDIPKIFRDVKLEIAGGVPLDQAVLSVVRQYQQSGGRMLNPRCDHGTSMTCNRCRKPYPFGMPSGRKCCHAPELRETSQGVECQNCMHWESHSYNDDFRSNPHGKGGAYFIIDPQTNKVLWIVRGHPMYSFNNSVKLAAEAAAKLGRSVIHVVHPYVPAGWKKGTVVTPLFYSYGANLVDARGGITQRNPRCNPAACKNPGHRHPRKNPMLQMVTLANPKTPACPQCDSKNTGSEYKGEWYCYDCGHQWMKKPLEPRKNPLSRGEVAETVLHAKDVARTAKRLIKAGDMSSGLRQTSFGRGMLDTAYRHTKGSAARGAIQRMMMRFESIETRKSSRMNPLRPAGVPYCHMCGNWSKAKGPYKPAPGNVGWMTGKPMCRLCREGATQLQAEGFDFNKKTTPHRVPKRGYHPNPSGAIPFKQGQIITVQQALAWAKQTGNAALVKQCNEAIALCKKANGPAQKVRFDLVQMGDPNKIESVMAGVEYGETDETVYKPTKGSKKGQHLYRHEWGEGSGRRKPVPLIAPVGGKALVMPLGKGQKATDWLRG